jgi:hypothetical protein
MATTENNPGVIPAEPYPIEEHKHRFASWAASRAASVKGCRFKVERGKAILERSVLPHLLDDPMALPAPPEIDPAHRVWRDQIIAIARAEGCRFTHGVAAKLINVYLKAAFVCGGHHFHPNVRALHPPIDAVLLDELLARDVGNLEHRWRAYASRRWSNFDSATYEAAIADIRSVVPQGAPLWTIEQFWQGYQGEKPESGRVGVIE